MFPVDLIGTSESSGGGGSAANIFFAKGPGTYRNVTASQNNPIALTQMINTADLTLNRDSSITIDKDMVALVFINGVFRYETSTGSALYNEEFNGDYVWVNGTITVLDTYKYLRGQDLNSMIYQYQTGMGAFNFKKGDKIHLKCADLVSGDTEAYYGHLQSCGILQVG